MTTENQPLEESPKKKRRVNITPGAKWGLLISYVSAFLVGLAAIQYANYVNNHNNQRWCSVLVAIDDAYADASNNPNISKAGRHIGEEFHRLRIEFQC